MRSKLRYRPLFAVLAFMLLLLTVPMSAAASSDTGMELPGPGLSKAYAAKTPVETVFVSAQDNMAPVDRFIHRADSGGSGEKPADGYHSSFRETLLRNGYSLANLPARFPVPLGYAGRIRCLDTVIAYNLGGNAPPFSFVGIN